MPSISYRAALRPLYALCASVVLFHASAADVGDNKSKYGVAKPLGDVFAASTQVDSS